MIITKRLKLKDPSDVRNLIKSWLSDVIATGDLPFEKGIGGVVVQMLQVWLKSYEIEKLEDVEKRIKALEAERDGGPGR
jgi:hypothetical protein